MGLASFLVSWGKVSCGQVGKALDKGRVEGLGTLTSKIYLRPWDFGY